MGEQGVKRMHMTQFSKEIKNDWLSHIDNEVQLSNFLCHLR
jgi:hypothetical protein